MRISLAAAAVVVTAGSLFVPAPAGATAGPSAPTVRSRVCPPSAAAISYSDALDKVDSGGVRVGGLSSLAYDRRRQAWAATVDNYRSEPSRIWFFRDLARPRILGAPLVLRAPNGTPYDGTTADDEGLAVLPDGNYLVSSETEPSLRIFGRDGVQRASLPVPARFRVAPAGEATANATLEGLTISPSGRTVVAAMESALSGDSDATAHRFLVYAANPRGHWSLRKQVAYRAEPGLRIPEVSALDDDRLLVEQASFDPAYGNVVKLFEAIGLRAAPDVSAVADLSQMPGAALRSTLVADLGRCPTLGATAKQTQPNPLLDNYEAMALTTPVLGRHAGSLAGVSLLSDDNFGTTQITRLLNLGVRLPR